MAKNLYFSDRVTSEQNLYEDIIIESLKIYGQDVYYLPRDIVNKDPVFGDDVPSKFNSSYKIEMYIENVDGFDGEGDLFTKFGVEIRDQASFVVSRRRWTQTVARYDNEINGIRPLEGDLIYLPLSNSLFQIMAVEHEQPFYQISNLPTYKLRCELFEYNDEDLDTGIDTIDSIEQTGYELKLTLADSDGDFIVGETVTQTLGSGVVVNGEVTVYDAANNFVKLAHIGSDDGLYHTFTTGTITGTDSSVTRTVTVINDEYAQVTAQNEDFRSFGFDFLDFSESNPFGEPENN
jgi:hypothetical protein